MAEEIGAGAEGVRTIEFRAMGSQMLAAVRSDDPAASEVLARVPGWFAGWEQTLSRFKDDSELSNLNRSAGGTTPIAVSDTLWEVLQLALNAARATDGLVTPTVLNALEAAGYSTSFDDMKDGTARPSGAENNRYLAPWHDIKTDPRTRSVVLPRGARLDFGGIAKGWAADQAASRLAACGPALMDAGGDIALSEQVSSIHEWLIGIDAPSMPPFEPGTQLELLAVKSGGVATSGRDYRRWQKDSEWKHHIIDPRTGLPASTDIVAATIVGPSAREAEIAAKVVLLLGSEEGTRWLEERPEMSGLLVLESGQIIKSTRLSRYIWSSIRANQADSNNR